VHAACQQILRSRLADPRLTGEHDDIRRHIVVARPKRDRGLGATADDLQCAATLVRAPMNDILAALRKPTLGLQRRKTLENRS
jgi:hypothetical protein